MKLSGVNEVLVFLGLALHVLLILDAYLGMLFRGDEVDFATGSSILSTLLDLLGRLGGACWIERAGVC